MTNSLPWVRSILTTTPKRWLDLTNTLPIELLTMSPAPEEWAAIECLQHLVDTERLVFPERVKYLLAEEDFPAFDPDSEGSRPIAEQTPTALATEFERLRTESLVLFDTVAEADLGKQARHQELGIVTLSELLHE